ncbi:hypothetical protein BYT27DRAFT_7082785 [Phlegmacium glaucopus]|nr:hypothetical protein BYT27DRAFT_7082785 [Phlegmacium glaucopus]
MADITSTEFYWDVIIFKVEDTLFRVPRCEFEQSSEVFADMFCLPSGAAERIEGQDKEHPIVLEGYRKNEFSCLLKVMYPRYALSPAVIVHVTSPLLQLAQSLISGTKFELSLEKEEWVSVLKLSTIWNMNKIREYAIHWLSTNGALTPIEKIRLARAHKVATWLEEGLTSLVGVVHSLTREELATLGWETSALIFWTRDNLSPYSSDSTTVVLSRDMIKCAICSSSPCLIGMNRCAYCKHNFATVGRQIVSRTSATLVRLGEIRCSSCERDFFRSGTRLYCSACSSYVCAGDDVRIAMRDSEKISEVFKEEINECKLAMSID